MIAELIKHIRLSGLEKRLFGLSSMDKLAISIYEPIKRNREALHITFNPTTQNSPEFVRDYPAKVGIEKFDNFIKIIDR